MIQQISLLHRIALSRVGHQKSHTAPPFSFLDFVPTFLSKNLRSTSGGPKYM